MLPFRFEIGYIFEFIFPFRYLFRKITNISSDIVLVPGFVDVHVHLREPGFSYKETIKTGTLAAANGGYAAICTMPNLDPVPDSIEHLERQLEIIRRDACIPVYPYGAITIGENGRELSDMDALAPYVVAFSDDGKGVQNEEIMLAAMKRQKTSQDHCCSLRRQQSCSRWMHS